MIEYSIEVENMTKTFRVVHREASIKSAALSRLRFRRPRVEEFVALEDISFQIPRGQTVGVIGRNGSGKSTLLTLMSRIYRPNKGRITVRGRVATLLELGAGFNGEFTGIENIFLNGVIMGIKRDQIEARLPEIVEFAGLSEFIDTKVKFYSSGMITRLGFSVAVHSDPDVLLVDEVLAVGDADFQEKCYAKIEEFKTKGVTIFFVSHDVRAMRRVADRILWIHDHKLREDGAPLPILERYEAGQFSP